MYGFSAMKSTNTMNRQVEMSGDFSRFVRLLRKALPAALIVAVVFVGVLYYLGMDTEHLSADVRVPPTAKVGEPFNLDVLLENVSGSEQTVVSFALETEMLDSGLIVISSIPAYRSERTTTNWTEFVFSLRRRAIIAHDSNELLRISLLATRPGSYSGELVVWFNNQLRPQYIPFEFEVGYATGPIWLGG